VCAGRCPDGELRHVETLFDKRQASQQSLARVGIRRRVFLAGKRRVCLNQRSNGKYTAHRTESGTLSRRGGNFRRQFGDVLCLRQGKCRTVRAPSKPETRPWRLRRRRLSLRRRRGRLSLRGRRWRLSLRRRRLQVRRLLLWRLLWLRRLQWIILLDMDTKGLGLQLLVSVYTCV